VVMRRPTGPVAVSAYAMVVMTGVPGLVTTIL